ncbi:MAG: GGDEF domain-containing protein [Monoglobales bacterium]
MNGFFTQMSDILILVLNYVLCIRIIPLNKDTLWKKIIIFSGIFITILVYIIGITFFEVVLSKWAVVSLFIPSFILLFCFTKYKDMRFVMTFCFIETIAFIIGFISRYAEIAAGASNTLIPLTVTTALYSLIFFLGRKQLKEYKNLIIKVNSNWTGPAVSSIFLYILLIVIMAYPTPFIQRTEYGPVYLFLCLSVGVFYYVFISSISKTKKIEEANIELQEKNKFYELAYSDFLCELGNRAAFEKTMENLKGQCSLYKNICFVFMDINNMKQINDTYGHVAGDKTLICTAEAIKKVFSPDYSKAFRIGGDEFCVLYFNINKEGIAKLLQSLDNVIEKTKPYPELSIASGFAFWNSDMGDSMMDVFKKADMNMYSNKRQIKELNNNMNNID